MDSYNHPGSKTLPAVVFDAAQPRFLFDGQFDADEPNEFLKRYVQDAIAALEHTGAEVLKLNFTLRFLITGCQSAILKMIRQILAATQESGSHIAVQWVIESQNHVTVVEAGDAIPDVFEDEDRVSVEILHPGD